MIFSPFPLFASFLEAAKKGSEKLWPFSLFLKSKPSPSLIDHLYTHLMASVQNPLFYTSYQVEDRFESRFQLLILHASLLMRALLALKPTGPEIAQALTDHIFNCLDAHLREQGIGDLAIPKRMKAFASIYSGSLNAYMQALESAEDRLLLEALSRNLYGGRLPPSSPLLENFLRSIRTSDRLLKTLHTQLLQPIPLPFSQVFSS